MTKLHYGILPYGIIVTAYYQEVAVTIAVKAVRLMNIHRARWGYPPRVSGGVRLCSVSPSYMLSAAQTVRQRIQDHGSEMKHKLGIQRGGRGKQLTKKLTDCARHNGYIGHFTIEWKSSG